MATTRSGPRVRSFVSSGVQGVDGAWWRSCVGCKIHWAPGLGGTIFIARALTFRDSVGSCLSVGGCFLGSVSIALEVYYMLSYPR